VPRGLTAQLVIPQISGAAKLPPPAISQRLLAIAVN
jgi:hypothetical protein